MGRGCRRWQYGGAKGAAWCGRAAPKESPFEGIMLPESDPTAPVGSFRSFANALFRGICGVNSLFATFERRILPPSPLLISHVVGFWCLNSKLMQVGSRWEVENGVFSDAKTYFEK